MIPTDALNCRVAAMPLSERFDDALVCASRLHRMQTRKGSGIPYVSHLLAVCALVIEHDRGQGTWVQPASQCL
jgi:(p)ppGpp synthase/HD superfamily hydrolase